MNDADQKLIDKAKEVGFKVTKLPPADLGKTTQGHVLFARRAMVGGSHLPWHQRIWRWFRRW